MASQAALARNRSRTDVTDLPEFVKGRFFKTAQTHLKNIGLALSDASTQQDKKNAVLAWAPIFNMIDSATSSLRICWRVLKQNAREINYSDSGLERDARFKRKQLRRKVLEYVPLHGVGDSPLDKPLQMEPSTIEVIFKAIFRFFRNPKGAAFFEKSPVVFYQR